jgi:transcriptional regulator with XRE-family HTH domain
MKQKVSPYHVGLFHHDMIVKGWGQTELAYAAGLSVATVSRFFLGKVQTPKAAAKMAKALKQPLKRYIREYQERAS